MSTVNEVRVILAIDIGGTFSDLALTDGTRLATSKVLTTAHAPEEGVMQACKLILEEAGLAFADIDLLVHGTTLATNAIIERRGARTAAITTQGHRDTLDLAFEDRFSEYDIFIEKPRPLVERDRRFPVTERVSARGEILLPLDERSVADAVEKLRENEIESVAVGLIHSYANADHEQRVRDLIRAELPDIAISISSEVCPEIREYERFSTTCANAYIQPLISRYLGGLADQLALAGLSAPILMMMSGGGLAAVETARSFPVRLVESGPAAGAILAAQVSRDCDLDKVLSFDMGGTTAKICLIDEGEPTKSRVFEAGRAYNYLKGSGLPLRIPVIEMVEIGAGGGSVASVDVMNRIAVGPESAAADPGPACYGRGGERPTVTDADLVTGHLDPALFAGGSINLQPDLSVAALERDIGSKLGMDAALSAFAVTEIVDENMANAARIHAIERGKSVEAYSVVAFGGAGPVHAARLAEKIGARQIIVPANAGVGSAIGLLIAPIVFEVARSLYMPTDRFDAEAAQNLLEQMTDEAMRMVRRGAPDAPLTTRRRVEARYSGQGHEIELDIPQGQIESGHGALLRDRFEDAYARLFGQAVPGVPVELLNWTISVSAPATEAGTVETRVQRSSPTPVGQRALFDPHRHTRMTIDCFDRLDLVPGSAFRGPAVIVENQTTTMVPENFEVEVDRHANIVMTRCADGGENG